MVATNATQDGRKVSMQKPKRTGVFSLRRAIILGVLAIGVVVGLSHFKSYRTDLYTQESLEVLKRVHPDLRNLFQANFYFFYSDKFVPGVNEMIQASPGLSRVQVLGNSGIVLFDSRSPERFGQSTQGTPEKPKPHHSPRIVESLKSIAPSVFVQNFDVQIVMPSGQYGVLYEFSGSAIRNQVLMILAALLACVGIIFLIFFQIKNTKWLGVASGWARKFFGLRTKFLFTIVLVNLITGLIVYFTLSELQTVQETKRIQKESILFGRFSTDKIISDFSNYFYFYYQDKFLPAVRNVIATNENLVSVRVISRKTGSVLFDSETAIDGPVPTQDQKNEIVNYNLETLELLRNQGYFYQYVRKSGERLLSLTNVFKNESGETVFYVEYFFSFQGLRKSIETIRRQIILDLIPSMGLGLLIAILFAQFVIAPIRRLSGAMKSVAEGEYDVSVEMSRNDEIGDLLTSFNAMTSELRKKTELKKYLSDSTYRQIMSAPETKGETKLKGSRVNATVLFSDIRNFVKHCESMDAEEITSMLSDYFSEMVEVVYKYGGEVDKFIGDALLAVFYEQKEEGPDSSSKTALRSIHCSLEMMERLKDFNKGRETEGRDPIEIGVGITYGELISGPIGAKDRLDFTVIGDVVNLANRIEKLSKKGTHTKIVFSHHVEEKVRGLLEYVDLGEESIRGKEEAVKVFELVKIRELEVLVKNLESEDADLRVKSLELLGQSRNSAAIPHLIRATKQETTQGRIAAINSLVKLVEVDDPLVIDTLFDRLENEREEKVVSAAIAALGRVCRSSRIVRLVDFLESRDERIVANAIEALGNVHEPEATDSILPKLGSRNNRVKANAAMALFAAGHLGVIDTLKPMLMHSDPYMRSSAAFAIGELTRLAQTDRLLAEWKLRGQEVKVFIGELQECVPMLVFLLRDPEPMVKRQAVIALGKIKDKSAVLPIIDNIDLETDSKDLIEDIAEALREIGSHKLIRDILDKLR